MLKVGVVVARFQAPFLHEGHRAVLNTAMQEMDETIVLLGCSDLDARTPENPLLYVQREAMVRSAYRDHSLRIMPLQNSKSNDDWSKLLDILVFSTFPGCEAHIYIGRDSVVPKCYTTGKCKIRLVDEIAERSGSEIRASIAAESNGQFLAGQVFALNYQFPRAFPCVDVAVTRGTEVLLIQRADTSAWCFPGGFVDPTDATLEMAAQRELFEETGLSCEGTLEYVSSRQIVDWRYRGRDQIISTLFQVPHSFGSPVRKEETLDFKWLDLRDAHPGSIDIAHAQFFNDLRKAIL
jgi:bifunctional NMN adenylyltransferase/nudix hydrolase